MKPDEKLGEPGFAQSLVNTMVSAVVESAIFVQLGGCSGKGRNAPGNTATKGKRWGPPCGLSTIAFMETRLKAGKVQSVAPTQGIPPPPPPDNLPTAHSGLNSLRGFRQPLAPPTSWEVILWRTTTTSWRIAPPTPTLQPPKPLNKVVWIVRPS